MSTIALFMSTIPLFRSRPTALIPGASAAVGIAVIHAVGSAAGFVSPCLAGYPKDPTHGTRSGTPVLAAVLVVGAIATLHMPARLVNRQEDR